MRTYVSVDTVENEDNNGHRYPQEMLITLSHRSDLSDDMLNFNKGFLDMLLRNIDPRSGHVNETKYMMENMSNKRLSVPLNRHWNAQRYQSDSTSSQLCTWRLLICGTGRLLFPVLHFSQYRQTMRNCNLSVKSWKSSDFLMARCMLHLPKLLTPEEHST